MTLTINTNIPALTAQRSLTKATNGLNDAIEKLTTGFKINHSADNAANYSISEDMSTKISSYSVAESNVEMGIDLIDTAEGSLDIITEHLQRIRELCEQGSNGTYGDTSRKAIQAEIDARVAEINRIYEITEYNGIKLFENDDSTSNSTNTVESTSTPVLTSASATPLLATTSTGVTASKGPNGKFIDDIVEETPDVYVTNANDLASAIANYTKIGIGDSSTSATYRGVILDRLRSLVNGGTNCSGKTIILTGDVDLSNYRSGTCWIPIGFSDTPFQGTFNGNGHVVSNLYINTPKSDKEGLFGYVTGELKNVGIENCNITVNRYAGGLAVSAKNITNCYATGNIKGGGSLGGLVAIATNITNSYATTNITGYDHIGGLAGGAKTVTNCYATVDVSGYRYIGGLVGEATSGGAIINSYATGDVTGTDDYIGGLVASVDVGVGGCTIVNCYATGDVTSTGDNIGGLAGSWKNSSITDSYATGTVSGGNAVGGLVGNFCPTSFSASNNISNSNASGDVTGTSNVGGLVGQTSGYGSYNISNSNASGDVSGISNVGGLVGQTSRYGSNNISNSNASGDVTGTSNVGGLIGQQGKGDISDSISYAENVTGTSSTGSFVGYFANSSSTVTDCKCYELEGVGKTGNGTEAQEAGIEYIVDPPTPTEELKTITLQVGIYSGESSQISFTTGFDLGELEFDVSTDETSRACLDTVDDLLSIVSSKQTELGAVQNRLSSALESIRVSSDNLVSSRSTLRDTDVAKTSSEYIKQQILQQASATLLSTANQTPSIALQLI